MTSILVIRCNKLQVHDAKVHASKMSIEGSPEGISCFSQRIDHRYASNAKNQLVCSIWKVVRPNPSALSSDSGLFRKVSPGIGLECALTKEPRECETRDRTLTRWQPYASTSSLQHWMTSTLCWAFLTTQRHRLKIITSLMSGFREDFLAKPSSTRSPVERCMLDGSMGNQLERLFFSGVTCSGGEKSRLTQGMLTNSNKTRLRWTGHWSRDAEMGRDKGTCYR